MYKTPSVHSSSRYVHNARGMVATITKGIHNYNPIIITMDKAAINRVRNLRILLGSRSEEFKNIEAQLKVMYS